MRRFLQNMILLGMTFVFIALVLEVVFRILPVNTGLGIQPVNKENPYFRARPDQSYVYSKNWNFQLPNIGRINAQGFIHDQDYDGAQDSPLMAVFGDSYVEALMVPFKETVTGRLHRSFENKGRVYSFAFSGAPLSQYLMWAEHAKNTYKPDAATFVIISNDFDESLMKYKSAPGFHYLEERDNGLSLERVDYRVGSFRPFIQKSALLRYLVLNLKIQQFPGLFARLFRKKEKNEIFENNVRKTASSEKLIDSKKAVLFFLNNVGSHTGLPNEKILFVVDGLRQQIYTGASEVSQSYAAQMFRFFISQARKMDFPVIDMQDIFAKDYKVQQKNFEFKVDAHWNGYGHQKVAEAIAEHHVFQTLQIIP